MIKPLLEKHNLNNLRKEYDELIKNQYPLDSENWNKLEEITKKIKIINDVVTTLRKFKNPTLYLVKSRCKKCLDMFEGGFEFYPKKGFIKFLCFDCWFKECFGELPK